MSTGRGEGDGGVQGGSNMTGTSAACLHTNQSRSYLNHLVVKTAVIWQFVEEFIGQTRDH